MASNAAGNRASILLLAALINACSQSDSERGPRQVSGDLDDIIGSSIPSVPSGNVRFVGLVEFFIDEDNEQAVSARAEFFEFDRLTDARTLTEGYRASPEICTVEQNWMGYGDPLFARRGEYISAGETILLSSDGNTYGELAIDETVPSLVTYMSDQLVSPFPDSLDIEILGDTFPSFPIVTTTSFGKLEGFEFADAGLDVPLDTEIRWQVNDFDVRNLVQIVLELGSVFTAPSPYGRFMSLVCTLEDDGSFILPAALQQQIAEMLNVRPQEALMRISPNEAEARRNTAFVRQVDNSLLVVKVDIPPDF